MVMTQFEKAVVAELQGIKKELREMNKKEPIQSQVDGASVKINSAMIAESLGKTLNGATIKRN